MGRKKQGNKCIKKIIISNKEGDPALIYNLDKEGRLIYEYPVCVGIPGNIKYEKPGCYIYKPPLVHVYNQSIKKKDPSIVGSNSITVIVPSASPTKLSFEDERNKKSSSPNLIDQNQVDNLFESILENDVF